MSANSFPPPHRVGVLMSPAGRSLECSTCHLNFDFPDGAAFVAIAKQFELVRCGSSFRVPLRLDDRVRDRPERRFVILMHEGGVPKMASCAKCERKFFTPPTLARDVIGAEEYLGKKFDVHQCEEPKRW